MSEQLKSMKDAAMGEGGGLQSVSSKVGETIAGKVDTRGGQSKKSDEAGASIGDMSQSGAGQTTSGTNVSGGQQAANMQTGTADHLDLGASK